MRVRGASPTALAAATLALAACTSGQVGQYPVTHANPLTNGKLQFGVGWATEYPSSPAGPELTAVGYGINLVATYRQVNGRSAALTDSVDIDVPNGVGANLNDLGLGTTLQLGAPIAAFGAGLNAGSFTSSGAFNPLVGTGGPPAFPAPGDSTALTQQFSEGYYATFPFLPVDGGDGLGLDLHDALSIFSGTYTMNVSIPTGATTTQTVDATARLVGNPLPSMLPPTVVPDGNGGALVTIAIPARVTETIVTVVGTGCQTQTALPGSSPAPVLTVNEAYTMVSHKTGPATDRLTLPDFVTPVGGLGTYSSLCSAAQYSPAGAGFSAYAVGFDYPAFESVYPQNFSQTPAITGTSGQPDLTISSAASFLTP